MTDIEAVAGVLNSPDWCYPNGPYYDMGKELLTRETNAAIEGFFAGGVTEILVGDGHGHGAINPVLLDPRAELSRGWPEGRPFGLDASFDAIAWVGQHAKARTTYSHLTHTGSMNVWELSINGVAVGEFGELGLCAGELGVPCIFVAGEQTMAAEAKALVPDIETVAVKRGVNPDPGDDLTGDEYRQHNSGVITKSPQVARELIREGAERAARRFMAAPWGPLKFDPPYERILIVRHDKDHPTKRRSVARHPSSVIAVMNMPHTLEPMDD
jgi:D-amino peptidase